MTTVYICGICACETIRCYCLVGPSTLYISSDKWSELKNKYIPSELRKKVYQTLVKLILQKKVDQEVLILKQLDANFYAGLYIS